MDVYLTQILLCRQAITIITLQRLIFFIIINYYEPEIQLVGLTPLSNA